MLDSSPHSTFAIQTQSAGRGQAAISRAWAGRGDGFGGPVAQAQYFVCDMCDIAGSHWFGRPASLPSPSLTPSRAPGLAQQWLIFGGKRLLGNMAWNLWIVKEAGSVVNGTLCRWQLILFLCSFSGRRVLRFRNPRLFGWTSLGPVCGFPFEKITGSGWLQVGCSRDWHWARSLEDAHITLLFSLKYVQ